VLPSIRCLHLIPVESRDDLVLLVMRRVCEGVDVGCQACGGGCVYAGHVMIDAGLLRCILDRLFYEVDEFAQCLERL
jgi:hypothetical protein